MRGTITSSEHQKRLQHFLDHFHTARIGIRFLMGHYLSIHRDSLIPQSARTAQFKNHVGIICRKTPIDDILHWAADDARLLAQLWYGVSDVPEIQVECRLPNQYVLVPTHVHHMMVELFKNSLRATMEYRRDPYEHEPIKTIVTCPDTTPSSATKSIIISVIDKGKGMSVEAQKQIWSYFYTTASPEDQFLALQNLLQRAHEGIIGTMADSHHETIPIAGLGYGIPITRLVG
jgi:pyruvate dehydrogenase kinase 2/3/4